MNCEQMEGYMVSSQIHYYFTIKLYKLVRRGYQQSANAIKR